MTDLLITLVLILVKIGFVFFLLLTGAAYMVLAERKLLGRIRLPEVCGNVCFGGTKRNRLFMAASQSLYAVYVNTQGVAGG